MFLCLSHLCEFNFPEAFFFAVEVFVPGDVGQESQQAAGLQRWSANKQRIGFENKQIQITVESMG